MEGRPWSSVPRRRTLATRETAVTNRNLWLVGVMGVLCALAACGSAKDPSKANFETVLNDYRARNCILLDDFAFRKLEGGLRVDLPHDKDAPPHETTLQRAAPYDALVDAGLLSVAESTREGAPHEGGDIITVRTYDLTDKSKEYFTVQTTEGALRNQNYGFCAGIAKVDSVDEFSEPAQIRGYNVSHVSYTISPAKAYDWTQNAQVRDAFPALESLLVRGRQEKAPLVLMSDRWAHGAEVKP